MHTDGRVGFCGGATSPEKSVDPCAHVVGLALAVERKHGGSGLNLCDVFHAHVIRVCLRVEVPPTVFDLELTEV